MKNLIINKIGVLCIRNRKLLVVYKPKIGQYITLGGKINKGESDIECIKREVTEEICCSPKNFHYFKTFKGNNIILKCYFCDLEGKIKTQHEISKYVWLTRNSSASYKLAPILEKNIVPELIRRGLI